MSEELKRLVKPLARNAPVTARALDEAPDLVVKALAECTDGSCSAKPEDVHTALMGLPITGILTVLGAAEKLLGPILGPAEPPAPAKSEPTAKLPAGHVDQALGGEKLNGWKTIIGIAAAGVLYVASSLGIAPMLLTPEVTAALYGIIASWTGIGLIAKVDRVMSWLRPVR